MKVMLDKKCYVTKPQDLGALNNRILYSPVELQIQELAQEVIKGRTFTPAFFKETSGKIHRMRENWHSQEIVALDFDSGMTVEQALNEFATTACFMYTTFSHTDEQHKFRVVFVLEKPIYDYDLCKQLIENLVSKYPMADQKCIDPNRLFFGGRVLHEIDYSNRLSVNDTITCSIAEKDNSEIPTRNQLVKLDGLVSNSESGSRQIGEHGNIDLIKEKNIEELQKRIRIKPAKIHNSFEVFDFLKKQDLREFLGVSRTGAFKDIFHDECSPSSSVFESEKGNGHQLYKCFSASSSFCGTIIEVTERVLICTRLEAKKFLMDLYQIEILESEQQKELREELDCYKELLLSDDLEELYPNFYKVFNRHGYIKDMYILLDLVKEYLPSGTDKRLLFYQSIESISKKFNKSTSATHIRINFFAFFEFLTKLDTVKIPVDLYQKQLNTKRMKQHKYLNNTYEIHIHRTDFFAELDEKCKKWIEKCCTSRTMNYEGIYRNFGREEADRIFPQDKGKAIPLLSEEVTEKIRDETLKLIDKYGWTTEQEILENVTLHFKGQNSFKMNQLKICLGELIDGYDLEKIRLNKSLKEEMGISEKGYPNIIRKKQHQ